MAVEKAIEKFQAFIQQIEFEQDELKCLVTEFKTKIQQSSNQNDIAAYKQTIKSLIDRIDSRHSEKTRLETLIYKFKKK